MTARFVTVCTSVLRKGPSRTGLVALVVGGVLLAVSPLVGQAFSSGRPAPSLTAEGATLLDARDGDMLFGKKADAARPLASTVKIMVATMVLDTPGLDLEHKVTIRQRYRDYVTDHHASTADLQTGDRLTVRQLLYASLLPSGADAAYALADTFGAGDTPARRTASFIARMNATARALHLEHTRYTTFGGTGKDTGTPNELAALARHALRDGIFRTIVRTRKYKSDAPAANGRTRTYTWTNTNQLLGAYDGVIGLKTGTTARAGKCLVFAATHRGKTLVGTVLHSDKRYTDAAQLLDLGFGTDNAEHLKIREHPAGTGTPHD
ncbi:D-alanyl-D-alanine carboxypeptidase [Streptomyces albus subsp. chlorinus]|uniref:D-alanyl-D-alanine carboxypeptidase family protein n=1 Tax=Streptomyces albus TaxID=1888 RepID=UPI00156E6B93|nr:serine hydrolase [Streptomyces albus]NSC22975.1 D-alanyl-D-alanine carboxypeptidase [Streptomyces albus subsp. chlorinus]